MSLPANGANPQFACYAYVRLGGLYDTEVACFVAGLFTGRLETAPAGQGLDGGFTAPGGGWIRLLICNPASAGCLPTIPPPAGLTNPMYFELAAAPRVGAPEQRRAGYY